MWAIVIILIISLLISSFEVPKMVRKKETKELVTFAVLLVIAVFLNIRNVLHSYIPSPIDLMKIIYSPISAMVEYWLG
jgi:NhaP-type Na+/H+ or K+/H+ antiporter